ncbi:MAG: helix-turn-helix transcriptional regulator [Pseudomonadota bacterium]
MEIGVLIGENVRAIRQKRQWSQEDLAFESGLHRTYVSGIERGARNPTAEVIEVLAIVLSVNPAALFAGWQKPEE